MGWEENEKNKKDRKTCGKREGRGDRKLKYNALYCPHFFVIAFLELATKRIKVVCIQTDEFICTCFSHDDSKRHHIKENLFSLNRHQGSAH